MLDKAFLKHFFTWLEGAALQELKDKRSELQRAMAGLVEPDARRDARFLLKHLNREILEKELFGPDGG